MEELPPMYRKKRSFCPVLLQTSTIPTVTPGQFLACAGVLYIYRGLSAGSSVIEARYSGPEAALLPDKMCPKKMCLDWVIGDAPLHKRALRCYGRKKG